MKDSWKQNDGSRDRSSIEEGLQVPLNRKICDVYKEEDHTCTRIIAKLCTFSFLIILCLLGMYVFWRIYLIELTIIERRNANVSENAQFESSLKLRLRRSIGEDLYYKNALEYFQVESKCQDTNVNCVTDNLEATREAWEKAVLRTLINVKDLTPKEDKERYARSISPTRKNAFGEKYAKFPDLPEDLNLNEVQVYVTFFSGEGKTRKLLYNGTTAGALMHYDKLFDFDKLEDDLYMHMTVKWTEGSAEKSYESPLLLIYDKKLRAKEMQETKKNIADDAFAEFQSMINEDTRISQLYEQQKGSHESEKREKKIHDKCVTVKNNTYMFWKGVWIFEELTVDPRSVIEIRDLLILQNPYHFYFVNRTKDLQETWRQYLLGDEILKKDDNRRRRMNYAWKKGLYVKCEDFFKTEPIEWKSLHFLQKIYQRCVDADAISSDLKNKISGAVLPQRQMSSDVDINSFISCDALDVYTTDEYNNHKHLLPLDTCVAKGVTIDKIKRNATHGPWNYNDQLKVNYRDLYIECETLFLELHPEQVNDKIEQLYNRCLSAGAISHQSRIAMDSIFQSSRRKSDGEKIKPSTHNMHNDTLKSSCIRLHVPHRALELHKLRNKF